MERETGFEPATSTLARSHSTTELFPPILISVTLTKFTHLSICFFKFPVCNLKSKLEAFLFQ